MEGKSMRSMKMAHLNTSGTEINTVLWRWFCTACANGYPISGPILQSKALSIANVFEADHNFKASNGWLEKWKKRQNVNKSYAFVESLVGMYKLVRLKNGKLYWLFCLMGTSILQLTFSTWMRLDTFIVLSQIQRSIKYQNHAKEEN